MDTLYTLAHGYTGCYIHPPLHSPPLPSPPSTPLPSPPPPPLPSPSVEDLERNNGRDRPYFMSNKLMKLLNAKNVKEHTDGDNEALQMESLESVQQGDKGDK